ncbi:hypothetical protein V6Z12_D01G117400 [Gossypium hirsutum]
MVILSLSPRYWCKTPPSPSVFSCVLNHHHHSHPPPSLSIPSFLVKQTLIIHQPTFSLSETERGAMLGFSGKDKGFLLQLYDPPIWALEEPSVSCRQFFSPMGN